MAQKEHHVTSRAKPHFDFVDLGDVLSTFSTVSEDPSVVEFRLEFQGTQYLPINFKHLDYVELSVCI
jgi:hypothetical protein